MFWIELNLNLKTSWTFQIMVWTRTEDLLNMSNYGLDQIWWPHEHVKLWFGPELMTSWTCQIMVWTRTDDLMNMSNYGLDQNWWLIPKIILILEFSNSQLVLLIIENSKKNKENTLQISIFSLALHPKSLISPETIKYWWA